MSSEPPAQGSVNGSRKSLVDLHFSCQRLSNLDVVTKSDPMCVIYEQRHVQGPDGDVWKERGRTEVVKDNLNPVFTRSIRLEYIFEVQQIIRVDVYDVDDTSQDLKSQDLIGSITVPLATIVSSQNGMFTGNLALEGNGKSRGILNINAEEVNQNPDGVVLCLEGRHLDKKDLFGKSDPYIKVMRVIGGKRVCIYRTEVVRKTLDPVWSLFVLSAEEFCGTRYDDKVIFECWDWDEVTPDDFIGECSISFNEFSQGTGPITLPLIDPKRAGKHGYKNSGELFFVRHERTRVYSFIDYLRGGCEFNLITAIDFTSSNGNPSQKNSLHYISESTPNQYELAIRSVGNVLLSYDPDGNVPVYGFGAVPHEGKITHCFAVNGTPENPEVHGVQGILDAYHLALKNISLGEPTNLAPVIQQTIQIAQANLGTPGSRYFVLLIITDGLVNDMVDTIRAIVYAANYLPISIVIVGVGNANFSAMEGLDGDLKHLRDKDDHFAARDVVQFVPFSAFSSNPERLAEETLAEIPRQLCSFMRNNGVIPRPPMQVPIDPQTGAPMQVPIDPQTGAPMQVPIDPQTGAPMQAPVNPQDGAPMQAPVNPQGGAPMQAPVDPQTGAPMQVPVEGGQMMPQGPQ